MAHAPGWIELYEILERGGEPPAALVDQCLLNRNGIGETMLHWYALEGTPDVLQRLVDLGFDVDTRDDCGARPIVDAAAIGRWDNVRVLRRAGAATRGVTPVGWSYRGFVSKAGDAVPEDLRGDAYRLEELLDPDGPEDTEVLSLLLTRIGIADDAPGEQLTWEQWERYLAAHPQVNPDLFSFEFWDASCPGPSIEVTMPDRERRRQAHAIALHFGARVVWCFCCGSSPDVAR